MTRHRRPRDAMEDGFKALLSRASELSPHPHPFTRAAAERALDSVPQLEAAYLRDRNPVHVWDAIAQIEFAYRTLGRHPELPPWVLAYLFTAAVMIAGTVTAPSPPVDGPEDPNSLLHTGLTAEQRMREVMQALGFSTGRRSTDCHRRPTPQEFPPDTGRHWAGRRGQPSRRVHTVSGR